MRGLRMNNSKVQGINISINVDDLEKLLSSNKNDKSLIKNEWLICVIDSDGNTIDLFYRKNKNYLEVIIHNKDNILLNMYMYEREINSTLELIKDLECELKKTISRG